MARLNTSGRTVAIIAAIVLAAVATYALFRYVDDMRQEAFAGAELVEVYTASDTIPAGVSVDAAARQGLFVTSDVPREDRPEGAITGLDQVTGLYALDRILPGEILQLGRFGEQASLQGLSIEIPEDREAISVEVGVPEGVAGYVQAGDRISMIAHIAAPAAAEPVIGPDGNVVQQPAEDGAEETRAQYLLQGIEVLAVGQRVVTPGQGADGETAEPAQIGLFTIAVTPEQAERLVFAIQEGTLHFTLLPDGAEPADTPGRTFENLFGPN